LYDIAQLKGVDWVDPGTPITRADLEGWEKKSGVKAGPGDVIVLYTGRWKRRVKIGEWAGQVAGYYADTIPWITENVDRGSRPAAGNRIRERRQIELAALSALKSWRGANAHEPIADGMWYPARSVAIRSTSPVGRR
jgi:putative cyclase